MDKKKLKKPKQGAGNKAKTVKDLLAASTNSLSPPSSPTQKKHQQPPPQQQLPKKKKEPGALSPNMYVQCRKYGLSY